MSAGADVPNFSNSINQNAFTISGASGEEQQGQNITQATNAITNDWSGVDSALGQLQGGANYAQNAAMGGQGAVAGKATRANQQNLASAPQNVSDLGKALMQLGQGGAKQSADVGAASGQESQQFAAQANQLKQQITEAQLAKYQSDLQLSNAQFQITNKTNQATNGLQLAQQALQNQLQNALATASNAGQADQLQANQANMNQIFQYIGAGLGGASSVASGIASYMNTKPTPSGNNPPVTGEAGAGSADLAPETDETGAIADSAEVAT